MGAFIARQPNGLLCRFSTIVDTITDYNMTDDEYIEKCAEKAREEAREILKNNIHHFDDILYNFSPTNMTRHEFEKYCEKMGSVKNK